MCIARAVLCIYIDIFNIFGFNAEVWFKHHIVKTSICTSWFWCLCFCLLWISILHPWSQNTVFSSPCSPISGIVTSGCRMFLSTAGGWVILSVRQASLPKHRCLVVTVPPLPFLWKYSSFRSPPQEPAVYGQGESVIGWFSFDYETHVGQWGSSKGGSYAIIVLIKHLALRVEPLRSNGVVIN